MYNLYSYKNDEEFKSSIVESDENKIFKSYRLEFDSPFKTGFKENDKVYSEIFINKRNPYLFETAFKTKNTQPDLLTHKPFGNPLLILLHGFAAKSNRLDNYYRFIDKMIEYGFNCAFLHQPYHLKRTPSGDASGEKLIYFGDKATLDFYHQAVVDLKRFINIAIKLFKFDRVILCGFSLGSMIAVITSAVDKRIDKTVLIFGGGNWYQIHWNSTLAHILKGNCIENGSISKKQCRDFYNNFENFHEEFKKIDMSANISDDLNELPGLREKTTKFCFLCDPLAFADRLDRNKVLMINSKYDHFFPKSSTLQLWEKLNRPSIHWFNRLHTSKILSNPRAINIIHNFIKE
ncbi:MAG: hypothetical protein JW997_05900 [Actinobacteria bacterium]|nr:hypothetical protein [Actinomycetota bacterium]